MTEPQQVHPLALPPEPAAVPGSSQRSLDIAIKVAGLLVATALAVASGVYEAFYAPLRLPFADERRVPLSLVLALVGNPLLVWFTYWVTGRRRAALLPAAAWCTVWIFAAGRTSEGDLLITEKNWVGLLTLFAGPLAFAVGIFATTLGQPGRKRPQPLAPESSER